MISIADVLRLLGVGREGIVHGTRKLDKRSRTEGKIDRFIKIFPFYMPGKFFNFPVRDHFIVNPCFYDIERAISKERAKLKHS